MNKAHRQQPPFVGCCLCAGRSVIFKKKELDNEKIYMAIFLLIYFGFIIGIRSLILYRQARINAIKGFGTKAQKGKAEKMIQVGLLLMLVIGLNFIFIRSNFKYFIPINFLEISWLQTFGFILSMIGLLISFIAQLQMKDSWRLGIDENVPIQLVTGGFFSYSRNPVYLGLIVAFIGFFLIAPNVGSFLFFALMLIAINRKIIDEEKFLEKEIGEKYLQYKSTARRWI